MSIINKAKAIQDKRKKRYGDLDKKRNSKIRRKPTEKNLEVWSRNPGRSDMIGVDGEGTPTLKRDQDVQPKKRKKAAPKRRKAASKAKPQPKKEVRPTPPTFKRTKVGPGSGSGAKIRKPEKSSIESRIRRRTGELKDKKEQESRKSYTVSLVSPHRYNVEFKGSIEGFEGQVFNAFKLDELKSRISAGPSEKRPWAFTYRYNGRLVYASGFRPGFISKGYAITGSAESYGLLNIHMAYQTVIVRFASNGKGGRYSKIWAQRIKEAIEGSNSEYDVTVTAPKGDKDFARTIYQLFKRDYVIPYPIGWVNQNAGEQLNVQFKSGAKYNDWQEEDVPGSIVDNLSGDDRSKVSMKIDELAGLAAAAKAKGEAAPNYNLCEITIPGTNIYCEGNKGIERAKMPQFKGTPVTGSPAAQLPKDGKGEVDTEPIFRKQLKEEGIAITPKEIYSDNLKATQSELVGAKVAGMTKALEANPNNPGITAPIFVSNDNYVIDGHHRWAAVTSYAIKNGLPKKMKVEVIDLPIEEAIKKSNEFADMIGIAQKAATTTEAAIGSKKKKGVSERRSEKKRKMESASQSIVEKPKSKSSDTGIVFFSNDEPIDVGEIIDEILIDQSNYRAKFIDKKEAKAGISLAYERLWSQMTKEDELDYRNLVAHLDLCDKLEPGIRPYYPEQGSARIGLDMSNNQVRALHFSLDWKNVPYDTPEITSRVNAQKSKRVGNLRSEFVKSGKTVKEAIDLLDPITKFFVGGDDLRPVMYGVAFNTQGECAMTNAHVLFAAQFRNFDPVFPYYPERAITLPNGKVKITVDSSKMENLTLAQQMERGVGWGEMGEGKYITLVPPKNNTRGRYSPYTLINGNYPNYKAVIPSGGEGASSFTIESWTRLYKGFRVLSDYNIKLSAVKEVPAIHCFFDAGLRKEFFAAYQEKYLEGILATGIVMGSDRTKIVYQDNPSNKPLVIEFLTDYAVDTYATALIMPVTTYEAIRKKNPEKFERGGTIDEVELVSTRPYSDAPKVDRFSKVSKAILDKYQDLNDLSGKDIIVTTAQNGQIISIFEVDLPKNTSVKNKDAMNWGMQKTYRRIVQDLARGFVYIGFKDWDKKNPRQQFQYQAMETYLNDFAKTANITVLESRLITEMKDLASAYARGGRIQKREEEPTNYIEKMQAQPKSIVMDSGSLMSKVQSISDIQVANTTVKSIDDAREIFEQLYDEDARRTVEQAYVIYVDDNNKAKYFYFHSQGNQAGTYLEGFLICAVALNLGVNNFYTAHNHPSGSTFPSEADRIVARKNKKLANLLGLIVKGNLIINGNVDGPKGESFERGGYVHGPSHAQGGVDMPVKSTGQMVELEGGEAVINKHVMRSNKSVTLNGKRMKPCQAVSQINQMDGNGVPIQC